MVIAGPDLCQSWFEPKNVGLCDNMSGQYGQPEYFRVLQYAILEGRLFELPYDVYLVRMDRSYVESPKSQPICAFHYAGIRRYLWHDHYWSECSVNDRRIIQTCAKLLTEPIDPARAKACRSILDLIHWYREVWPAASDVVRAIYLVE